MTINAPSPGAKYSWFLDQKDCENIFDIDVDWNHKMIKRVGARSGINEEDLTKNDQDEDSSLANEENKD